ncbi:hypothetical protein ACWCQ1_47535 [Streptomyces sp. NPDC002144]
MFCSGDLIALGALHTLAARSPGVPEDVAVVGYDDIEDANLGALAVPRQTLGAFPVPGSLSPLGHAVQGGDVTVVSGLPCHGFGVSPAPRPSLSPAHGEAVHGVGVARTWPAVGLRGL